MPEQTPRAGTCYCLGAFGFSSFCLTWRHLLSVCDKEYYCKEHNRLPLCLLVLKCSFYCYIMEEIQDFHVSSRFQPTSPLNCVLFRLSLTPQAVLLPYFCFFQMPAELRWTLAPATWAQRSGRSKSGVSLVWGSRWAGTSAISWLCEP